MESRIRERFNDHILQEAIARYGIASRDIQLLDGFESFIYEFTRTGEPGILRIGHSLRRSPQLIQAEVDWINYLAQGGAGVAKALFSAQGNLVEAVDDNQGDQFLVTAFAKAPAGRSATTGGRLPSLSATAICLGASIPSASITPRPTRLPALCLERGSECIRRRIPAPRR